MVNQSDCYSPNNVRKDGKLNDSVQNPNWLDIFHGFVHKCANKDPGHCNVTMLPVTEECPVRSMQHAVLFSVYKGHCLLETYTK